MKFLNTVLIIIVSMFLSGTAMAKDLTVGLKSEPSSIDPHYHNLVWCWLQWLYKV